MNRPHGFEELPRINCGCIWGDGKIHFDFIHHSDGEVESIPHDQINKVIEERYGATVRRILGLVAYYPAKRY